VLFAITITGIAANTLVAPAIPDILDGLGAGPGAAGWVIGATTLPGIVLAPAIGAMADRYGRRDVVVPCLVVYGIAGGLCALANSIEVLALLRMLQGVGSAGLVSLAVVIIGDHWGGTGRAAMVGRNAAVLTVCLAVFPVAGGALTDLGGWRLVFLPFPLALVTAMAVWRLLPPDQPRAGITVAGQFSRALPALRSPQLYRLMLGGLLVFLLVFGLTLTVLPLYLEETFGLGGTGRGFVLGIPAIATTAAALSLGRLRGRWDHRVLLMAGIGLFVLGLLTVARSTTVAAIVAGVAVFGLGEGIVIPTLQERAASAGGPEARATVVAVFVSATRIGQTAGPVMMAGIAAGPGGPPSAYLAGVAIAAALGVLFAVGPPSPRRLV
jgi:MFS transporter, ACDE family, multidrug resistance protein